MEGDGGDFTFSAVTLLPCSRRIVAARQYPVFGQPRSPPRRGAPEPGTTAAQSPAPRCRKSGSTGSAVLRLVGLGRSHSDGKHRFVFFDAGGSDRKARSGGGGAKEGGGDVASWSYYARAAAAGGGGGNGGRRRTFLPYKQDLVGLFASATAFRRTYHPF